MDFFIRLSTLFKNVSFMLFEMFQQIVVKISFIFCILFLVTFIPDLCLRRPGHSQEKVTGLW